jgi:hypothetical protein
MTMVKDFPVMEKVGIFIVFVKFLVPQEAL